MAFLIPVATEAGPYEISLDVGETAVFVGANGAGKTRLAVEIERSAGTNAHRISAHRALKLNTEVPKISETAALNGLRYGYQETQYANPAMRLQGRWQQNSAVSMLNDFDFLVQALFAEQSNIALKTHHAVRSSAYPYNAKPTKLEQLKDIWERLLPKRKLIISGDAILVQVETGETYPAGDLSDGERAIFYMLGQALVASTNSLLIVDEPELHVHPSIMARLWDEIQAVCPECAFIFITHELSFAATRVGQKFVVRDYIHGMPPVWKIENVPENSGFDEELATLILGSRRPVLFVEGINKSLDAALYRACFPNFTVIPRGSCGAVIHSVVTMRANASLTRVTCAGLVDSDDYTKDERQKMGELGIAVLPVSEIENLILLPNVSRAIASNEGYKGSELEDRLSELHNKIEAVAAEFIDSTVTQYCRRRIDRLLKMIDLSAVTTPDQLAAEYARLVAAIDVNSLAKNIRYQIDQAIEAHDLSMILSYFDGKGAFMAMASGCLKSVRREAFEAWILRILETKAVPGLIPALQASLPALCPR